MAVSVTRTDVSGRGAGLSWGVDRCAAVALVEIAARPAEKDAVTGELRLLKVSTKPKRQLRLWTKCRPRSEYACRCCPRQWWHRQERRLRDKPAARLFST